MNKTRLSKLAKSPFTRLDALLEGISPTARHRPMFMQIGEPKLPPPPLVSKIIKKNPNLWSQYPSIRGTEEFRQTATSWLNHRYRLPNGYIDADLNLLPVAGTREALYMVAQLATPGLDQWKHGQPPVALMPNPMYHVYYAGAVMAGAEPFPVIATRETGFLPNYCGLGDEILSRVSIAYICTPGNPQGGVASIEYLKKLILLARRYNFLLAVDECYSEIYRGNPPTGALEACAALKAAPENVLVFHSLSKRSSVPGLRSGFVAGNSDIIDAFALLRNLGGPQVPTPIQEVAAALWSDESHVDANRNHYAVLFEMAGQILSKHGNFHNPPGGFFIWLDVGDGEKFAQHLWREMAVKTLPGSFMAKTDEMSGVNPGKAYIRVAMVDDIPTTKEALERIAQVIG